MTRGPIAQTSRPALPILACETGALVPSPEHEIGGAGLREAFTQHEFQHLHYEWFWLLAGRGQMKIEDKTYRLSPGDGCFLPPQTHHCDVFNAATPAYQSLWFTCRDDTVNVIHFAYEPVGHWNVLAHGGAPAPPALPQLLEALRCEMQSDQEYSRLVRRGLWLHLLGVSARVLSSGPFSGEGLRHSDVSQRVMTYLEKHYAQDVSLQDLARLVYLTPNYLTAVFKKETGQTIVEALTHIRLRHAKRLLRQGDLTVAAVAEKVGYPNTSYFTRVFQRQNGVSPGRFAKNPSELFTENEKSTQLECS